MFTGFFYGVSLQVGLLPLAFWLKHSASSVCQKSSNKGAIPNAIPQAKNQTGIKELLGSHKNKLHNKPSLYFNTLFYKIPYISHSIKKITTMATLRLGDVAPDFTAETSEGTIKFHEWLGEGWGLLFSHPADYTPVCTTELGTVAKYTDQFNQRNVKVAALSVDGVASHQGWIKDINETQNTTVNFPIIADEDKKVANLYDMIHPNADNNLTVRSVFIIAPDKTIKLIITYPASTGRNFDELIRVIDSLQLTAYHKVATPANWQDGDDCVVVPAIKTEDIDAIFPKGYTEVKPYLRMTPQPNK